MIFNGQRKIYCDSAATTPLDKEVALAVSKAEENFFNPSALYEKGLFSRNVLEESRSRVARVLSVKSNEIVFTSGGTESNNLALQGVVNKYLYDRKDGSKPNIVTTEIEHSSILKVCQFLEARGVDVRKIPVNEKGVVVPNRVKECIDEQTILVSVMYVNNETGAVAPLREISKVVKQEKENRLKRGNQNQIYFHTDASQAPLSENLIAETLGVDLMTLDGHKIYGPKGVGVLFVKSGTKINPILFGGGQENNLRPTTENIPAIVGFAEALDLASQNRKNFCEKLSEVKKVFIKTVNEVIPNAIVNGSEDCVPHIVNIHIPNIDAELSVLKLDKLGVQCSTKSSCMKGQDESYVIYAMTKDHKRAKESLRLSFLKGMKVSEAKKVAELVGKVALSF